MLFDIFRQLPAGKWFVTPKNKLKKIKVCRQSGYKASEYCPEPVEQLVPLAGEKTAVCPYHKLVHLDHTASFRVTDLCERPDQMIHQAWFILPPAMEYYYKEKHSEYKTLPPYLPGCTNAVSNYVMDMIYPKNYASVYIPLELNGERGKVIFTATHKSASAKIYWHIDNEYIGTTEHSHQLSVSPQPGKHTLTLVDDKGERLVQQFTIIDKERH